MPELKPGWLERQMANLEIEISIMPTYLLPPEMQEQRRQMTRAEIVKAIIDFYVINYIEDKKGDLAEFDNEVLFTLIPLLNKYLQIESDASNPQ
jgi:hypothetical protein